MAGLSFRVQNCYSGIHLRLVCSRHSCIVLRIVQVHNEIPVGSAYLFPDKTQGRNFHGLQLREKFLGLAPETCLATSIAASSRKYVPLLFGHLGNAQATLLEDLHVLQDPTVPSEFLKLLERDHLGEFLDEFDMYETPLRFLAV